MKKKIKKAFTLVELLVVIAILAILATVSIVGYNSFTKKAKVSNDTALVSQLNTLLKADSMVNGDAKTPTDALKITSEAGYDVEKLTPTTNDYEIIWNQAKNEFALLDENGSVVYGEKNEGTDEYKNWKFVSEYDANSSYSMYLKNNTTTTSIDDLKVGLDVGTNTTITTVNYANSTSKDDVRIRTNSKNTTLNINAENDIVSHFDFAKEVNISKIAKSSYHEYGNIEGNINLSYGRVELQDGASVSNIVIKEIDGVVPTSDNVKVTVSANANANLVISEVSGVSPIIDGNGASSVIKLEDVTNKVAAIGSKTFDTISVALENAKNDDTVVLLKDCTLDERFTVSENIKMSIDLNNHSISSDDRLFYVSNANSELIIKGKGKLTSRQQAVIGMVGSSNDDGKTYKLKVGQNVEMASTVYGIAIFSNSNSEASYGVDVLFEGHDYSGFGAIYVHGTVKQIVGNVPTIRVENALCDSSIYLGGFSKFYATNSIFNLKQSLNIKSGEIHLSNNTFNIDCSHINNKTADYVSNGNGAFGAKCGILFENGSDNYQGLSAINVSSDNKFNFTNTNGVTFIDAMYIDYTKDTSYDIQIDVQYYDINDFKAKIAYSGKLDNGINCGGYVYFLNADAAKAYTKEMLMEQYGINEITSFGEVESI